MLELGTLTQFNKSWKSQSLEQVALELASVSFETHHRSDRYCFLVGENDFISPETGQLIRQQIDTKTVLGKKEGIVYENLYSWAKDNESGLAAWLSPPSEGLFPGTKIILHEIIGKGREKFVLNRAILADIKAEKAVEIANLFSSISVNSKEAYSDPEEVRSHLFKIKNGVSVIDLVNLFVDDPELIEQIKSGQDLRAREKVLQKAKEYSLQIKSGVPPEEVYSTMVSDGFIGSYDISCPSPTFSNYIVGHAGIFGEYKHVKNCGNCGVVIDKLIKKGYRCISCNGEYQGC